MRRTALLAVILFSACAHDVWICDRLYFGQSIPGGETVSDAQWRTFMDEVVTPRFPAGLTVYRGDGQWRGASGIVQREPVRVIEILHRPDAISEQGLREIITEYKRRFQQEAVLRVRTRARTEFAALPTPATTLAQSRP